MATEDRGFASMDEQKRKDIASKGGQAQGAKDNPANLANNKKRASKAGKKGGENSRSGGNS